MRPSRNSFLRNISVCSHSILGVNLNSSSSNSVAWQTTASFILRERRRICPLADIVDASIPSAFKIRLSRFRRHTITILSTECLFA